MTKKDYIKLAQALKDSKPVEDEAQALYMGAIFQWQNSVMCIVTTLAQDNPRFNRAKFLQACGYTE